MKTLSELRAALLQTVEDVREKKMPSDEAIAIAKSAQTVINLTRLEIDYLFMTKSDDTSDLDFFKHNAEKKKKIAPAQSDKQLEIET